MAIFDLFSKRRKRERGEVPDVYVYDQFPKQLRLQIIHIVRDALGTDQYGSNHAENAFKLINDILCREYGVFQLTEYASSLAESVFNHFLQTNEEDKAFDFVELSFRVIDKVVREGSYQYNTDTKISPDAAIEELNGRLKEHGLGYEYESGELIRIDSQFVHSEAVKPTLAVLRGKIYRGANDEFLKAHEHYRHARTTGSRTTGSHALRGHTHYGVTRTTGSGLLLHHHFQLL